MLNQEEYDDISMAESLMNDSQRDTESLTQVIVFLYSSLPNLGRYAHARSVSSFFFFFLLFSSVTYTTFYSPSIDIIVSRVFRRTQTYLKRCNFNDSLNVINYINYKTSLSIYII